MCCKHSLIEELPGWAFGVVNTHTDTLCLYKDWLLPTFHVCSLLVLPASKVVLIICPLGLFAILSDLSNCFSDFSVIIITDEKWYWGLNPPAVAVGLAPIRPCALCLLPFSPCFTLHVLSIELKSWNKYLKLEYELYKKKTKSPPGLMPYPSMLKKAKKVPGLRPLIWIQHVLSFSFCAILLTKEANIDEIISSLEVLKTNKLHFAIIYYIFVTNDCL